VRFRRKPEEEPRLGIAPLVDIVFLLLIFFMLTSHFDMASGVRIRLPKSVQRVYERRDQARVIVVVDSRGRTYMDGHLMGGRSLKSALVKAVEEDPMVHLILQADKNVRHGRVVRVMDLAKTAGIRSIVIAAKWKTEKPE